LPKRRRVYSCFNYANHPLFVEYISMMDFRPYLTYLNDTPEIRIYHELRPAIQQDRLEVGGLQDHSLLIENQFYNVVDQ
jgi:hypothetical protein